MTTVRPRRIVHRGRVEASGFLLDTELIGIGEARRRILELWAPGVQVFKIGLNYYVKLHSPLRVDCAQSPGTPLVAVGLALAALPLMPDEIIALGALPGSVIQVKGGIACVTTLQQAQLESPADWLDISAFKIVEVKSLGLVYEKPTVVTEPGPFDVREKLEGAPAATPKLLETIAALKARKSSNGKNEKTNGKTASASPLRMQGKSLLSVLKDSYAGSVGSLLGWIVKAEIDPSAPGANSWPNGGTVSDILRRFATRLLHTTRLSGIIGRRQAAYMVKMMDMFERGDIGEALRHAIPLGDLPSNLGRAPAFGVPKARANLSIVAQRRQHSTAITMGGDVLSYLRQLYRNSFDRLVAQHRFEEAAFVLAELLRDNEEAVAFLERHGKLRLAAELAEARELPAGLVVRQWFLAGEVERAVRIARRTHAFADALIRLEKKDKEQAEKLRLVWAESLAGSGNYASAVDVIWPVVPERQRARGWMDRTIEIGGPMAARMLARKLSLVPEEFEEVRSRVLAFLEDESFEQRDVRLLFAEALCRGERNAGAQTLARATVRAILRDAGEDCHSMRPKEFGRLVDFSGDGALRTDVPPFPIIRSESSERASGTHRVEFSAMDCGSTSITDAALLGDGRMLISMGEAGVRLLTRDGRTVAHFDEPAHRLVLSDHGDRAIALARRGEVWSLARLDLLARRSDDWCEAHIDAFAPNFDGSLWFIGAKGDFYAIDATANKFDAFWRVPEAGQRVVGVARSSSSCRFLTTGSNGLEKWVYHLPLLTLRIRAPALKLPGNLRCMGLQATLADDGVFVDQSLYCNPGKSTEPSNPKRDIAAEEHFIKVNPLPVLQLRLFHSDVLKHEFVVGDGKSRPGQPEVLGSVVVSPVYEDEGAHVRIFDVHEGWNRAEFFLAKATQVSTRLREKTVTIADNCGRVIVFDIRRNCLIRNLRV